MVHFIFWVAIFVLVLCVMIIFWDRTLSSREEKNFTFGAGLALVFGLVSGIAMLAGMN